MVGGSLRVLRLLPPLKLFAMMYNIAEILLKVALNTENQINQSIAWGWVDITLYKRT
jgi:hypothetical protein